MVRRVEGEGTLQNQRALVDVIRLRLVVVVAASFLLFLVLCVVDLTAREQDGMPSELASRWPMYTGERFDEEQVIIKSLKSREDRLYVNDEPFVVTHQTLIVDERGRRLRPGSIWVGWLVELRYRTGQKSEARSYGPDEKVLVRMRVLKRLLIKEDLLE
jgi:hypothetical protein